MKNGLLIAESPDGLRGDLCRLFQREFPGIQIDGAGTLAEVERLLETDLDRDVKYILVILNMQFLRHGEEPFVDPRSRLESLSRKPCQAPDSYFLVSATPGDNGIGEQPEPGRGPGASVVFPRGAPGWDMRLRDAARPVIHPKRINARIDEIRPLFGRGAMADPPGGAARPAAAPGVLARRAGRTSFDPTQRLANLIRDIEVNWRYLDRGVQEKVRKYFVVRPAEAGGVDVSLL